MATRAHEHTDHIIPLRVYLGVGFALLFMTIVTVWVSKMQLGPWNAIVALAIASLKALLVALFFMHLFFDKKLYLVVVSISLVILGIFMALTMADILRRGDLYDYQVAPIRPTAKIYDPVTGQPLHQGGQHESHAPANERDTAAMTTEPQVRDTLDTGVNPEVIHPGEKGKEPDQPGR
jgi:cytochrome c oxidase subunit 4